MHIFQRRPSYAEIKNYLNMSYDAALDKAFVEHIISGGSPSPLVEPVIYIPRDAGFFSVFNFYIGLLYAGFQAYPFYNRPLFLTHNGGVNKHFCYWTKEENAWNSYFDPILFHEGDDTHKNLASVTKMRITIGEKAPCEFRNPYFTKLLMQKSELWDVWRHRVHDVYSRHIRVSEKIQNRVDAFWDANVDGHYVIGIHYRHPSHHVESGRIYLYDYLQEVNKVIDKLAEKEKARLKIFIASDNELGIMAFTHFFREIQPFYMLDVDRCNVDSILQWAFARGDGGKSNTDDFINGIGYQYHYKKCANDDFDERYGEDVMCETSALSRCHHVVHGVSNIALAVSYINPSISMHPILPTT